MGCIVSLLCMAWFQYKHERYSPQWAPFKVFALQQTND
jgi:hypothetical protein